MRRGRIVKQNCQKRLGSSLAVSLVLMSIISFGSLMMAKTILEQQRLNNRRHQLHRAYYAAEGGIALVLHWSNFPSSFTPNPTLFVRSNQVSPGTSTNNAGIVDLSYGLYSNLSAALSRGSYLISQSTLQSMGVGDFVSDYQYPVSKISEIELIPPGSGDPIPCLFKIRAVGKNTNGIKRTILAYIKPNEILGIKLNAALVSFNDTNNRGSGKVHWGEIWAKSTIDINTKQDYGFLDRTNLSYDPRSRYRTEGVFNFASNWTWGSGQDLMDPTRSRIGDPPASGNFANGFEQRLTPGVLTWPDLLSNYQKFKAFAISKNRYYSTDAAGNIYRGGIEDSAHRVSFDTEFNLPNRDSGPYDMVFIDTIDGQPPAANGSNLAVISPTNSGLALKGFFWIGANVNAGSVGNPPSLDYALDSSGNRVSLSKIFLDGVMYSAGAMTMGANSGVYGSVIAQKGFTSGGGPDIYYNPKLANGLLLENGNIGSSFSIAQIVNY